MNTLLSHSAPAVFAFTLNLLIPITVVCAMVWFATRTLFPHNPSVRYGACLFGLLCVLSSPLVVCLRDRAGFGLVQLALPQDFAPAPSSSPGLPSAFPAEVNAPAEGVPDAAPDAQQILLRGVWTLFAVWGSGVAYGSVRLLKGWKAVRHLRATASPRNLAAMVETRESLERVLGCSLPPICTSPSVDSPVAVGPLSPLVILPEGLVEALSPVQLRHVLLHECAHVAFHHTLGGIVERITRLVFWPHPLVHALCRELARAREEICDDVASQEDGAACYARTLFAIAQGLVAAPNSVPSALALLGPESSLEDRIAGLLDPRRKRRESMKQGKLWAVGTAVFGVLALTVAVRVVATETKKQDTNTTSDSQRLAAKREAEAKALATSPKIGPDGSKMSDAERLAAKREAEARALAAIVPDGNNMSGTERDAAKRDAEGRSLAGQALAIRKISADEFEICQGTMKLGKLRLSKPGQPAPGVLPIGETVVTFQPAAGQTVVRKATTVHNAQARTVRVHHLNLNTIHVSGTSAKQAESILKLTNTLKSVFAKTENIKAQTK